MSRTSTGPLWASASAPMLPSIDGAFSMTSSSREIPRHVYSRQWTTENKRLLHERRERRWLQAKAKHKYLDFTDSERRELRRYFDALADSNNRLRVNGLEDMMVSLGLADSLPEVQRVVDGVANDPANGLDYEEFLNILRTRADPAIMRVFKAMMEGQLGNPNLNFQTVLSSHRRRRFMEATGARASSQKDMKQGARVLRNFATMERRRFQDASLEERAGKDERWFVHHGNAVSAGLQMMWVGECNANNLDCAGMQKGRAVDRPKSPSEVIRRVLGNPEKKSQSMYHGARQTVFVTAPRAEVGEEGAPAAAVINATYLTE